MTESVTGQDDRAEEQPGARRSLVRTALRNPALLRLVVSLFVFRLGGAMTTVVLPLFVIHHYGLGIGAGLALGARLLPNILLGVFVGNLVDRYQPRTVAILTALANAGIVALFPVTTALWQIQVLSFAGGVAYMFGYPARMALRPLVMGSGGELRGNSMLVTAERLSSLAGPACAGVLIALLGLNWVFGIEAVTATVAAVLMLGLPDRVRSAPEGPAPDGRVAGGKQDPEGVLARLRSVLLGGWRSMLLVVRRDRMLLGLTVTAFTYVAAVAVGETFLSQYSLVQFPHIGGGNGYLMAAMGAGGAVGGVVAGRLGSLHQPRLYLAGNVLEGLCWLSLPLVTLFAGSLALLFAAGILESVATVVYFAEAQKRLPAEYSGRFYGVFIPITDVFVMLGATLGTPIIGHWGIGGAATTICLLIALPVLAFVGVFARRTVPAAATPSGGGVVE